jgi:hypothetical protein
MTMEPTDQPSPPEELVRYVGEHAPELDPQEVRSFIDEHPKPADEPGSHVAWAVRVLRQRHEGEVGEGLPVDRVVSEIRRRDR